MSIRVLLVDDVAEVRVVVRQALSRRGGFVVVGEAGDGAQAILLASDAQPDVIVLDLGLPDLAGREVLSRLRVVAPAAQIVVFTGTETSESSPAAREADAFVGKDSSIDYLVALLADLGRSTRHTATISLPPRPSAVGRAREWVRWHLREWDCSDATGSVELVLSELVTNAVVHAGTTSYVTARHSSGVVRLEVADGSSAPPEVLAAADADEHGRGLLLVATMAAAWGVAPVAGGGKLVWAELLCGDPVPAGTV